MLFSFQRSVTVGPSGNVFFSTSYYARCHNVYKLENTGLLKKIVGQEEVSCDCSNNNCDCFSPDNVHPSKAKVYVPSALSVGRKDNELIIADQGK